LKRARDVWGGRVVPALRRVNSATPLKRGATGGATAGLLAALRRVNSATPLKRVAFRPQRHQVDDSSPSELGDPIEAPSSLATDTATGSSSPSELGDPIEAEIGQSGAGVGARLFAE